MKHLAHPEVKERFEALGLKSVGGSTADLKKTMAEDAKSWATIVHKSRFCPD